MSKPSGKEQELEKLRAELENIKALKDQTIGKNTILRQQIAERIQTSLQSCATNQALIEKSEAVLKQPLHLYKMDK